MPGEYKRWLRQAEADLKAARDSFADRNFEWSCFQAQQSAEKALKAYLYRRGYTSVITHSLKELIRECTRLEAGFAQTAQAGRTLDMFYIPTRYPNGLAGELAPTEFYEEEDAKQCLNYAALILETVKKYIAP